MSSFPNIATADVRVQRSSLTTKRVRAAKAAARFIRTQASAMHQPADKTELARQVWLLYIQLRKAGMLAAPRLTKRFLRKRFGYWGRVGVSFDELKQ